MDKPYQCPNGIKHDNVLAHERFRDNILRQTHGLLAKKYLTKTKLYLVCSAKDVYHFFCAPILLIRIL